MIVASPSPMIRRARERKTVEFGDFQTPYGLAQSICKLLAARGLSPGSIVEPTCGLGSFLAAALDTFPDAQSAFGLEINSSYAKFARAEIGRRGHANKCEIIEADFFETNWQSLVGSLPEPILVVGNPPWVTSAKLGSLQSVNLPKKSNFKRYSGLDAKTGKSNFDISEWMLIHLVEVLREKQAVLAMLCKTAVARKVLEHAWREGIHLGDSELRHIDSEKNFGAAVDAGVLICTVNGSRQSTRCATYTQFADEYQDAAMAFRDGKLIADVAAYDSLQHLQGEWRYRWRSGIKHDCSKVMELCREGDRFRNGYGELVELEETHVYPMLKSSEVAKQATTRPSRWMLVPQRRVGEETAAIEANAPKTWDYLMAHAHSLDKRGSSIYKNRPRFAIFGVGDYAFADHKVAISGFYKKFAFTKIGCYRGKPIVLDDTAYFLTCQSEEEADCISSILNSDLAKQFFSAFVFWDSKRPITVELLKRLNILAIAKELHRDDILLQCLAKNEEHGDAAEEQRRLFS